MDDVLVTMTEFSDRLGQILGPNLLSVILFGSAVLGDFHPGEGDLDFVAVTQNDLTSADCEAIFDLHDQMRSGQMGQLAVQLEGTYYPLALIGDLRNVTANGCYVGTSRKGWKQIDSNRNSMADYAIIREHGITCYGEDVRDRFFSPSRQDLLDEIRQGLESNIQEATEQNSAAHAVAMFHWAPRALCYAMTGELVSKSKAAEWYVSEFPDTHWAPLVTHARGFRHYPLTPVELAQMNPLIVTELQGFLLHIRELFSRYRSY